MSTEAANAQPVIKLFWLEKSRSQRILWLLEELHLKYEIETFKRDSTGLAPPALKDVHPLGKSPVISVQAGESEARVFSESGFIVEYLVEHFGPWLQPKQWIEGREGQIGGETEQWLRYRFFMHYCEGSLMSLLVMGLLVRTIRNSPVPFFIKPITSMIAGKLQSSFLEPNFKTHLDFLEGQLATAPDEGDYLCGREVTGADILMSFAVEACRLGAGLTRERYPKLWAYQDRLYEREAYKRAVQKIVDIEGVYKALL